MLKRLISGGQYGADWAALKAAEDLGIETGGTAPKGWRVQNFDGTEGTNPELAEYGLVEHKSSAYPPRTRQNVFDSDGTVWFGFENSGGAKTTFQAADDYGKPLLKNPTAYQLRCWIQEEGIEVLNVAGNRLSKLNPSIEDEVYKTLIEALT